MKLSQWAKKHSITYRTAWNMHKNGKLVTYRLPSGAIMVEDEKKQTEELQKYRKAY